MLFLVECLYIKLLRFAIFFTCSYDALHWDAPIGAGLSPYATMGFNNAGVGGVSFTLPGSKTSSDVQAACFGSSGNNGCYIARIDGLLAASALAPSLYSGTGPARDRCAQSLTRLYAFGAAVGDATGPSADDDVAVVAWAGVPFVLFGVPATELFASTNGLLSTFSSAAYTPQRLPFADAGPSISIWWADGTTIPAISCPAFAAASAGNLYWRVSSSPATADALRLIYDVSTAFPNEPPFVPSVVGVVTWFAWAGNFIQESALNTVQIAFGSDSSGRSFVTLW